jgi:hypothetical protein
MLPESCGAQQERPTCRSQAAHDWKLAKNRPFPLTTSRLNTILSTVMRAGQKWHEKGKYGWAGGSASPVLLILCNYIVIARSDPVHPAQNQSCPIASNRRAFPVRGLAARPCFVNSSHFCGNSIQAPFHEPFTHKIHFLQSRSIKANQAQSR